MLGSGRSGVGRATTYTFSKICCHDFSGAACVLDESHGVVQSCRNAIEMLTEAFKEGFFGTTDAKVIYGQTDSLFINFRSSSVCA